MFLPYNFTYKRKLPGCDHLTFTDNRIRDNIHLDQGVSYLSFLDGSLLKIAGNIFEDKLSRVTINSNSYFAISNLANGHSGSGPN